MEDLTLDLPPEYCHYQDDGCEFAQSCLNCHLPVCVYDEPGGKQRLIKRRRALEIARLFTNEKKSIGELAVLFKVSKRTVQRALKSVDEKNGVLKELSLPRKRAIYE